MELEYPLKCMRSTLHSRIPQKLLLYEDVICRCMDFFPLGTDMSRKRRDKRLYAILASSRGVSDVCVAPMHNSCFGFVRGERNPCGV
jgi:hypothetical protein